MYPLGKKSTSAKRGPEDGRINEKVEEAKENKPGKPTVSNVTRNALYSVSTTCVHDCAMIITN